MGGASRKRAGQRAEAHVAAVLVAAGWTLLARNWVCPGGELDLVVAKDGRLRVIEVKYRRRGGGHWELVGRAQQRRLVRATERFVAALPRAPAAVAIVVAEVRDGPGGLEIDWWVDPFDAA